MPTPTPTPPPAEHDPAGHEFERRAAEVAALIQRYWSRLRDADPALPVLARTRPGDVLNALPAHPPEQPEPWADVLSDLDRIILPNLTHWQHPSFFAFFSANASPPAVLGDFLASGLGVQGMLWTTSPACTEVETRMLDWLAEALGLPAVFCSDARWTDPHSDLVGRGGGVIQATGSESTLAALLAARHRQRRLRRPAPGPDELIETSVFTSRAAHSSVLKAAMIAGVAAGAADTRHVRLIETDAVGAMDLSDLERVLESHLDAGLPPPCMVTATVGTTSTGAVDGVGGIRDTLDRVWRRRFGGPWPGWLHVDAAWAGAALVCPEHRGLAAGLDRADSFFTNPHKWLLTNFDCSTMWTRCREDLIASMSINPDYLRNAASDSGEVIDYRDWHVPLGRRFRALKLWLVLRHYGLVGLRAHVRAHVRAAEELEGLIARDERFEQPVPRSLGLVCFRLRGPDDGPTRRLMERVNASGAMYVTPAVLPRERAGAGRLVIRFAVGATFTTAEHVRAAWSRLRDEAGRA